METKQVSLDDITKDEFEAYEAVRESGITNMFDTRMVGELSDLSRATIKAIMLNYAALMAKWPDVRK